jgi:CDP-diacylglycerol--glycerol-3-phosphate 3-phosphatidyltransferase
MIKEANIPNINPQVQTTTAKLQVFRKAIAAYITQPIVFLLAKTAITPNMVTWFGFILILLAASLVATGHPFAAGWVVLLSGFFDILDGALARRTNQVTRFGAALDSTLDRISEAVMLLGIMAFFLFNANLYQPWIILLIGVTMLGSFLVSYIRARAEALNIDCQVGIFTRTERVIILALGLLLSGVHYVLVIALAIIAILSIVTVIQRLVYVYQQAKKLKS